MLYAVFQEVVEWGNDSLTTTMPKTNKGQNLNGAGSKDEAKNPKEIDMVVSKNPGANKKNKAETLVGDIAGIETVSIYYE